MLPSEFLEQIALTGRQEIEVAGRVLRPGYRVRLKPQPTGDLLDKALAGRIAVIEGIDEDETGTAHVAVIVEDDPGRDLGKARHPAHRFFFAPSELEPLERCEEKPERTVLIAGIGNIFLGDDGFGVAVARQLFERPLPMGVEVADFGIRGMDLAYALGNGYEAVILVDLLSRGVLPGTLHIIEPDMYENQPTSIDTHRLDPVAVLNLAGRLGQLPKHLYIVGCEPQKVSNDWCPHSAMTLSAPVAAAVEKAADAVIELAATLLAGNDPAAACDET